jgi:hypothetical protein
MGCCTYASGRNHAKALKRTQGERKMKIGLRMAGSILVARGIYAAGAALAADTP